jgi:hypothetical protein
MKWEYKIVDIIATKRTGSGLPADLNEHFDKWGTEGWELVGTESIIRWGFWAAGTQTYSIIAFFKRPASN